MESGPNTDWGRFFVNPSWSGTSSTPRVLLAGLCFYGFRTKMGE
jgi:hypothetical protein